MIRKGGKQTPSDGNGKKGQKSQNNGTMMGSKTFIFCLGTAYDVSNVKSGSCDHVCAWSMIDIRVCIMNGSMIEHNGLGIIFFSIYILKGMVAC